MRRLLVAVHLAVAGLVVGTALPVAAAPPLPAQAAVWHDASQAGPPQMLVRDHGDRDRRHYRDNDRDQRRWRDGRDHDRHGYQGRGRGHDRHWHRGGPPRGWGPPPHVRWSRGDVLPHHYRKPYYVVHDWRSRRYAPPPRGYQWMRVDGETLLVGIATGMILQSIIDR